MAGRRVCFIRAVFRVFLSKQRFHLTRHFGAAFRNSFRLPAMQEAWLVGLMSRWVLDLMKSGLKMLEDSWSAEVNHKLSLGHGSPWPSTSVTPPEVDEFRRQQRASARVAMALESPVAGGWQIVFSSDFNLFPISHPSGHQPRDTLTTN